jgi:two-component system sensor histidine kinase RegB
MVALLLLLPAANVLTRLRHRVDERASDAELFLQLLFDVVVLSCLLYLSGGSANPFVSLYLLPLVVAAVTLRPGYAWALAGITVSCYGMLFFVHRPLQGLNEGHSGFHLHLVGMWATFVLSAAVIAFFVTRMSAAIRLRDAKLARQKEEALRNERIVALATLAAGAAHELGTPLSTMAVLLSDLALDRPRDTALQENLKTLRAQVDVCKQSITHMVAAAGEVRAEGGGAQPLDRFLNETIEHWRRIRPAVSLEQHLIGEQPVPYILSEQTLRQAIVNLLDNAADASPDSVELECGWDRAQLHLEIRDRGPGIAREGLARAGRSLYTTKAPGHGTGMGLLLAKATLERLGGHLSLIQREGGGMRTLLELPLASLMSSAPEPEGRT